MNKKSIFGLILFAFFIVGSLYISVRVIVSNDSGNQGQEQEYKNNQNDTSNLSDDKGKDRLHEDEADLIEIVDDIEGGSEEIDSVNGDGSNDIDNIDDADNNENTSNEGNFADNNVDNDANNDNDTNDDVVNNNDDISEDDSEDALVEGTVKPDFGLIYDSNAIDYEVFIPKIEYTSEMEIALDIDNPDIGIEAEAALLLDLENRQILYHKNPTNAVFPASTIKLLTAMVTLDKCDEDEQVKVGDEVEYMATDSSRAWLKKGQVLTIRNLLEGLLLPSGNDAAYVIAVYVGRKSLEDSNASGEESVLEFIRLMNEKAKALGADNSSFMTPDGYDAIGQYTTAYDMGMIGLAAVENETILEISKKCSSRNVFVSGEDVTWDNSNHLINKNKGGYYQYAIGLKTGSSTMAGKCLIGAAQKDGRTVICVIMNSTQYGRYEDASTLLKHGLK